MDEEVLHAILSEPRIDGRFDGPLGELAERLGRQRPLVLFAFAPRSAGTFLRSAAIEATGGQLTRLVHAEGGRDGALYLPWVMSYFSGSGSAHTVVTHAHMQASEANRHFLDAFAIKPIIMLRSIPDMLSSLWGMIEEDNAVPLGFSFVRPRDFAALSEPRKADLFVDLMGPWYAQYFASWKSYAEEAADRVCVLYYEDFCDDPAEVLETALAHARVPQSYACCQRAVAMTWLARSRFRCNRGAAHRTVRHFNDEQLSRLERMVSYYPELGQWQDTLLSVSSENKAAA